VIEEEIVAAPDDELIRLARGGDASGYEALVRRYQESAFRAAFLVLRDSAEAEDAAQDAFVKAFRALHRFKGESMRPWLLKIVMNESRNRLKSRKRRDALADRASGGTPIATESLDESVINREQAELLRSAIDALKEHERALIQLRFFLRLSEAELGEYFGCPPGTIKSRLNRTLAKLRVIVAKDYPQLTMGGVQ
jgi:RNA polymerase sigma-70 factor (ECF subfamily)